MTSEIHRPSQEKGAQELLITLIMKKLKGDKDLFCAGDPIEHNNAMEKRGDEELMDAKKEHMYIIASPKIPLFNILLLNRFASQIITKEELEKMGGQVSCSPWANEIICPSINFPVKIGVKKTEITTKQSFTIIDESTFKRMKMSPERTLHRTIDKDIENLITVYVFPDTLSAKIAYAYLSEQIEMNSGTNLDVRTYVTDYNPIDRKVISFLRGHQEMEVAAAAKFTQEIVNK